MRAPLLSLTLVSLLAGGVEAHPVLLAHAQIAADSRDLSAQTAAALENGVPGNLLGGIGSALDYAGGGVFVAMPDRGPNAVSYNAAVDNTASYIPRFQTFAMTLEPSAGEGLPYRLTPRLKATTLLWSATPLVYGDGKAASLGSGAPALNDAAHFYFSGRSDNFVSGQSSLDPANARLDPEGIRVAKDGQSVFVSDEYGPCVYQFDRASGKRIRAFTLPGMFGVAHPAAQGEAGEIAGNTSGRVANKGMEGLALTPDGKTLAGIMQAPLLQDGGAKGGTKGGTVRIVLIDIASGAVRQYAYVLTNIGSAEKPKFTGISEMVAVSDHVFLVDERDGKGRGDGTAAVSKKLYRIDLSGASEVSGLTGVEALAAKAVAKTPVVDMVAVLTAGGIAADDIPGKIEGVTFGPDVTVAGKTLHTLWIASDNDFLLTADPPGKPAVPNPNEIYVIGVDDTDLGGQP